jgi:hypothetical protein
MNFTFGIVTTGDNDFNINKIIDSIEQQNIDNYEIIIVGNSKVERNNTTIINFDETIKNAWITKKKNIITDVAKYENVVYLHDYIKLDVDWYKGQLKSGNKFYIRQDKIKIADGTRAGDWLLCMWDNSKISSLLKDTLSCLLPYNIQNLSKYMYVSGAYFIAKKNVMQEFPFNEKLSWGESEDVEWSFRIREKYPFQINTNSSVIFMKQKEMPFVEPKGEILSEILKINEMNKNNKFKIIIASFNNEDFVDYNVASVLNQTYTNYDVLYIDDASTDDTYDKVQEIVGDLNNWKVIKNTENKGGIFNYFDTLDGYIEDKEEIIIHLDGDDWFYDENVLEKLNTFYNNKNCWMTYGGFLCFDGSEIASVPHPQSTEYSDFVHRHKIYRKDEWRASHMRTYKAFLMDSINKEDLKSLIDNKYYWHAGDLAVQFIFLEMCPKDKI